MAGFIQVTTTTDKREDAEGIARALVEARLAGCVQIIGPLTSVYRWKGKIERAEEWLCLVKSREELYEAIEAAIRSRHPKPTLQTICGRITGKSSTAGICPNPSIASSSNS